MLYHTDKMDLHSVCTQQTANPVMVAVHTLTRTMNFSKSVPGIGAGEHTGNTQNYANCIGAKEKTFVHLINAFRLLGFPKLKLFGSITQN